MFWVSHVELAVVRGYFELFTGSLRIKKVSKNAFIFMTSENNMGAIKHYLDTLHKNGLDSLIYVFHNCVYKNTTEYEIKSARERGDNPYAELIEKRQKAFSEDPDKNPQTAKEKAENDRYVKLAGRIRKIMDEYGLPEEDNYSPKPGSMNKTLYEMYKMPDSDKEAMLKLCAEFSKFLVLGRKKPGLQELYPVLVMLLADYVKSGLDQCQFLWSYLDDNLIFFRDSEQVKFNAKLYSGFLTDRIGFDSETTDEMKIIFGHRELGENLLALISDDLTALNGNLSSEYFNDMIIYTFLFNYNNKKTDDFAAILIKYYPYLDAKNSHKHLIMRMLVSTAQKISNIDYAHAIIGCFLHAADLYKIEAGSLSGTKRDNALMASFVINNIIKDIRKRATDIIGNLIKKKNIELQNKKQILEALPVDSKKEEREDGYREQLKNEICKLETFISSYELDDIFVTTAVNTENRLEEFKAEVFSRIDTNVEEVNKHFPDEVLKQINNELLSSEITVECLRKVDQNGFIPDYSAALLPMMKSLEVLLTFMYSKRDKEAFKQPLNSDGRRCFTNRANPDNLELGTYAYLFTLKDTKDIDNINEWWNFNNEIINIPLLRKFNDVSMPVSDTDSRNFSSTNDEDVDDKANAELLYDSLLYVSQTFRNPTAHTSIMKEDDYNTCKELIVSSQKLLWILMGVIALAENNSGGKTYNGNQGKT